METIELKRGENAVVKIDVVGAQSVDVVDCKILFDRTAFQSSLDQVRPSAYVTSDDADLVPDFDDDGLKVLISIKSGKKQITGDGDLFEFGIVVANDALPGEYEFVWHRDSFALPVGKNTQPIPSDWENGFVKIASLTQRFRIRIVV